jgi:hypothetical protein
MRSANGFDGQELQDPANSLRWTLVSVWLDREIMDCGDCLSGSAQDPLLPANECVRLWLCGDNLRDAGKELIHSVDCPGCVEVAYLIEGRDCKRLCNFSQPVAKEVSKLIGLFGKAGP